MTLRPRRLVAAATVVAALALAGCGGGSDDKSSEPSSSLGSSSSTPLANGDTSDAPADDNTAGADSSGDSGSSDSGDLADVLSKSMKDGNSAHVSLDMGGQGSGEGDISFGDDAPSMQLSMTVAGQKTEMRMVDGAIYVAVPGQAGKFIKTDAGAAGAGLGGMDPTEALKQLEKAGGGAKQVGKGHWQVSQAGASTDMYVGDDGYLQKIVVDAGTGKITMTYSDWGKKVTVKAPAAGDIVKMPGS